MTTIIIDNDNIEEVEMKENRVRLNRKELKSEKDQLQIRRVNDKARIDEIDLLLTKFQN